MDKKCTIYGGKIMNYKVGDRVEGMKAEIKLAEQLGIEVVYR